MDLVLPEREDLQFPEAVERLAADRANRVAIELEGFQVGLAGECTIAQARNLIVAQVNVFKFAQEPGGKKNNDKN